MNRAHAIGSLLRPPRLVEARAEHDAGRMSTPDFKAVEDRAVDDAVRLQEVAGLGVVNDGEMRRTSFMDHLLTTVTGTEAMDGPPLEPAGEGDGEPGAYRITDHPLAVVEKIRPLRMLGVEEYCYTRARTDRPVKVTMPSPLMFYTFWTERSRDAYPDPFDLFGDWAAMLRAEIEELARLGCTRVQIDAPDLAILVDPEQRAQREALGVSVERTVVEGAELIDSMAATPGVSVSLHLCKGNFRSMWTASGGYEWLAARIFGRTPHVDTYLLEFDDDRSGDFAPLRHLPDDSDVVLGLVSTKRPELEPLDALLERVAAAEGYVGRERIGVSPQCGFASVAAGANLVGQAEQQAKLARVAELAAALGEG